MAKKNEKKKLLEIYRDGNFIYVSARKNISKTEWHQIIGAYSCLIEQLKMKENKKCLN